jgi:DNA-binding CsgD family transcriptional regulator
MVDGSLRIVDWLSGVVEMLREPLATMPSRLLLERLRGAYDCNAVSWTWKHHDGAERMMILPEDALLAERSTLEVWQQGGLVDCHPLTTWFAISQDPNPMTNARVPTSIMPAKRRIVLAKPLARLGMEQQLSIPYRLDQTSHSTFVVGRGGRDFSDDDLALARYVRQSLITIDRQTQVLARRPPPSEPADVVTELTGREVAVLQLLAEGRTTRGTAYALGCSPRTVEKHLERSYRKLGVCDRVNAIRVGVLTGTIGLPRRAENGNLDVDEMSVDGASPTNP